MLVLDLSGVFDLEYTALKMLVEAEKRQREMGVTMWLAGMTPGVLATVKRSPLGKALGTERMLFNLEQAIARYEAEAMGEGRRSRGDPPKRVEDEKKGLRARCVRSEPRRDDLSFLPPDAVALLGQNALCYTYFMVVPIAPVN